MHMRATVTVQAIVQRPSSDAWLNHALVRQLVFHDLAGAEQAYLRVSFNFEQHSSHAWNQI
jgi:hypothetical protein